MKRVLVVLGSLLLASISLAQQTRLENLQNKTILLFTPHPDDDVFGAGGTIALLNRNHNRVYIVVYTNDDKGSYDPDMTSQRLAEIRKAEQEASEGLLGTSKGNISWMGYDDGMLEYAPQPKLTEEATAIVRRIRRLEVCRHPLFVDELEVMGQQGHSDALAPVSRMGTEKTQVVVRLVARVCRVEPAQ